MFCLFFFYSYTWPGNNASEKDLRILVNHKLNMHQQRNTTAGKANGIFPPLRAMLYVRHRKA